MVRYSWCSVRGALAVVFWWGVVCGGAGWGAHGRLSGMYLKVRVSLETAQPMVTRLIAMDPALTLDRVHAVLQSAFGWSNSHLHQFTQRNCRVEDRKFFIYPYWEPDMLEVGSFADPETDVSIGELLREAGDFCYYEYDFGDSWVHRLELEGQAEPADFAYVIEGAGQAPEEDSRGRQADRELPVHVLSRDALAEVNARIEASSNPRVSADVALVFGDRVGPIFGATWERIVDARNQELNDLCVALMKQPVPQLTPELQQELVQVLAPWVDFLDEAEREIPLTKSGYLAPKFTGGFVEKWKINAHTKSLREVDIPQMWRLHEVSKAAKLTRKYRSTLRLSSTGKAARNDPPELIRRLSAASFARYSDDFFRDAMVLGLMLVATGAQAYVPVGARVDGRELRESVAELLGSMGWMFNGAAPDSLDVTMATEALETVLDPLHQHVDPSPELARYCAWQALKA